jgi:2'-5' RNA ligase
MVLTSAATSAHNDRGLGRGQEHATENASREWRRLITLLTVLFPFMPPDAIDPSALTRLGELFAGVSQFRFRLHRTDWFGDDVLWLAPQDPGPFRALTQRVCRAYPAFPPFEGQFDDVVPHLTIGHGRPLNDLRTAEDSVQGRLPIEASATAVTLMTQQSAEGHWTKTATFPLR